MNLFTDALFMFIYLFALFYFGIPNIKNDNYLMHKVAIFIAIFAFNYVIQLIKKIRNRCQLDPINILVNSLFVGLIATIGYSIYVDLIHMSWSKDFILNTFSNLKYDDTKRYSALSLLIVLSILIIKLTGMIFNTSLEKCVQKEQQI
jgi:RsiW-degrading membrane proteinase PrsW (M82 family)